MTRHGPWSEERLDILKMLWIEGFAASEIATRIGGVTRNAVIGKMHRLGLARKEARQANPRPKRPKKSQSKRPRSTNGGSQLARCRPADQLAARTHHDDLPPLGPAPPVTITIAEIKNGLCRWPEGDPKSAEFHFCGRPADATYCAHHSARSYERNVP